MKIAILSNVNLDMLCATAAKKYEVFATEGYGQWVTYAVQKNAELSSFAASIIFLIIDGGAMLETCGNRQAGIDEISRNISYVRSLANNYPESLVAVSTIDVPDKRLHSAVERGIQTAWEYEWSEALNALKEKNIVPFELGELIKNEGRSRFYSDKMWYMGSIPYSIKAITALSTQIDSFAEKYLMTRKKVLVCDLDNTLWGGVAGEDGPEGIVLGGSLLGAAYRDAQKRIKEIAQTGILLAIVSKNNLGDVEAVFEFNPHMVLKKDDFVSIKANWLSKSENIKALAQELNLGLDSFVFLDDNEVEREEVRAALPQVNIADFPKDPAALPAAIGAIYKEFFFCLRTTDEDKNKSEQYRIEVERKQSISDYVSMDEYLRCLEMHIIINEVRPEQYERAVQLMNKTNQFNTNTLRMDMQGFMKYISNDGNKIFVANVSDKYGDSGLVAELAVHIQGEDARIDNMLMSCRVMGREIECAIVRALEKKLEEQGITKILSSYVKTEKNKPVEELWDRLGFTKLSDSGERKEYERAVPSGMGSLIEAKWN